MKYWFDCEFHEDGTTIDLISIGFVDEVGQAYYAETEEYDKSRAFPWLKENVLPLLDGRTSSKDQIALELKTYLGEWPEIWGWYGSYDWVCLCQLYGTMMDLPEKWPMYQRETMNLVTSKTVLPPRNSVEHHALNDAIWQKEVWESLQ